MANMKRNNVGLLALENRVVLFSREENKIMKSFQIDEAKLKSEIDNIMEEKITRPVEIFKEAVEKMLFPYKFFDIRIKIKIAENEICIHDQEIFKKCKEYITSCKKYKKRIERFLLDNQKIRIQEQNNGRLNAVVIDSSERTRKKKHLPWLPKGVSKLKLSFFLSKKHIFDILYKIIGDKNGSRNNY